MLLIDFQWNLRNMTSLGLLCILPMAWGDVSKMSTKYIHLREHRHSAVSAGRGREGRSPTGAVGIEEEEGSVNLVGAAKRRDCSSITNFTCHIPSFRYDRAKRHETIQAPTLWRSTEACQRFDWCDHQRRSINALTQHAEVVQSPSTQFNSNKNATRVRCKRTINRDTGSEDSSA